MIDVQLYIDKLEVAKADMNIFIDKLEYSYRWDVRIIERNINSVKGYGWLLHDKYWEVSSVTWKEYPRNGCGKPDKIIGDIEIKYLWKQFRPKSIRQ